MASASSAATMRPVRIRSSARPSPTIRGRRWVPPSISGTPQRRSGKPSVEPSAAIRRSHHSASSRPAGQAPARDRGDRRLGRRQAGEAERPAGRVEARRRSVSIALRSAPAQKATSPAPVSTSTRASSSASKRRSPRRSSRPSGRRPRCGARAGRWSAPRRRRRARSAPRRSSAEHRIQRVRPRAGSCGAAATTRRDLVWPKAGAHGRSGVKKPRTPSALTSRPGLGAGGGALAAFLRASLRLSRRHWRGLSRRTRGGRRR